MVLGMVVSQGLPGQQQAILFLRARMRQFHGTAQDQTMVSRFAFAGGFRYNISPYLD